MGGSKKEEKTILSKISEFKTTTSSKLSEFKTTTSSKLIEYKDWLPLVILIFVLLLSLIITLSLVRYNSEKPDVLTPKRTLLHHFPKGDYKQCCSTEENKGNFLKQCNEIFKDYDIECTDAKSGSIIIEYETRLLNTEEVMNEVVSTHDKIGEYCKTEGHESEETVNERIRKK